MEQTEVKKRGRGRPRKRRRDEEEEQKEDKLGSMLKRHAFDMSWKPLVGRYLLKEFPGSGIFLGKVVYYDRGLYRVDYEDGDCEDLDSRELRDLIVWDTEISDEMNRRKWKLDELLFDKRLKREREGSKNLEGVKRRSHSAKDADGDSISGSSETDQDADVRYDEQVPVVPPPLLPPSTRTLNIPDQCAASFFSVYTFLRSFSVHIFLHPFSIEELSGAINFGAQNSLIDSIHVSLMHALKRHLEMLASEGVEHAIKALRGMDWSLLDSFTWPAFVYHYFIVMGYAEGSEWSGFCADLLSKDYYTISIHRKIKILQILCDDVLDSAELKTEVDIRGEAEVGLDPDLSTNYANENAPRRILTRFAKSSACKEENVVDVCLDNCRPDATRDFKNFGCEIVGGASDTNADGDGNGDECRLCGMDGTLICCDGCPSAYHTRCVGLIKTQIPDGPWYCPECTIMKFAPIPTTGTSLSGAVLFGIDPYEQVFLGTCNHLLVLNITGESGHRYFHETDISKVLKVLLASAEHRSLYLEISKGMEQYWHLQGTVGILLSSDPNCDSSNADLNSNKISDMATKPDNLETSSSKREIVESLNCTLYSNRCITENSNGIEPINCINGDLSHSDLVNNGHVSYVFYSQNKGCQPTELGNAGKNIGMDNLYMEVLFKPHSYINYYVHGEFSASAAAKLAFVSEESRGLEVTKANSTRKASSDISLQLKAFSAVASRFFWPSNDKKLIEVPRERCGWCYSCKLPSNSRRGCYLNAAAINATKSAWRILNGLRPVMNGDGILRSMSTYILYLEEMLHGVTVGLFKNSRVRVQWRGQVEDASSFLAIRKLLLQLEENIRPIALLGEWHKASEDSCAEYVTTPNSLLNPSSSHKRFLGGKYQKKYCCGIDLIVDDADEKRFVWWRDGTKSNSFCYKAKLPTSVIRKSARQGGSKRIIGVFYVDNYGIPKRSRSLVWRSAVETCKSFAQLAFQVRHLDSHVRWIDLLRADQNIQDVKGPEAEASFFRNAIICDKKMDETRIIYGVDFKGQKHLPSRIMKNVIEAEQLHGGKLKYWFWEINIPLYLIKEYEEALDAVHIGSLKNLDQLSLLQKKQLRNSRRDILAFLLRRRDKVENCLCASCQREVLLRSATVCNSCQGYCHVDCTVMPRAGFHTIIQAEKLVVCMTCCNTKGFAHSEKISESPTTPLPMVALGTTASMPKSLKLNTYRKPTDDVGSQIVVKNDTLSTMLHKKQDVELKQTTSASEHKRKICNWGLIWRKKREESDLDSGINFRSKNIILKGNPDKSWLKPVCRSCSKEYNRQLMYIHCECCNCWFHAEAVELEESRLNDLIGFKCCRCRRIKPPLCPYSDEPEKPVIQRSRNRPNKHEDEFSVSIEPEKLEFNGAEYFYDHDPMGYLPDSLPLDISAAQSNDCVRFESGFAVGPDASEEEVILQNDLPFSLSRVENYAENHFVVEYECNAVGLGARKLPVRRQSRHQGDDIALDDSVCHGEDYGSDERHAHTNNQESPSCIQWRTSGNLHDEMPFDCDGLNYEDMEFEPQTYFSFTELLAGEGDQSNGFDASATVSGNSNNDNISSMVSDEGEICVTKDGGYKGTKCKQCAGSDPVPDLFCEICGITIHSHCSPWVESQPVEGSWRCGQCRDWR